MPRTQVKVREHARRKPYQEEKTHVDNYVREQELSSRPPVGAAELGPHEDDDIKYLKWSERSEWSREHERECEDCGQVRDLREMVQMPGGEWYCQPCAQDLPDEDEEPDIDEEVEQIVAIEKELHPTQEFLRMGETEYLERGLLSKFGLGEDYDSFNEVPKEILDKVKCPHCSGRQFTLWGEPEAYGMGSIDLDKAQLEEDDHDYLMDMASQGGHPQKLVCDRCSSEFGSLEF